MVQNYNLNDEIFNELRDIIYKEAGIKLADVKKILMQSRLMKRLRALKLDDFDQYREYLLENFDDEKINFINAITTNKTDFFRENDHFIFMNSVVLPELEKKGEREIRIWSAGCSTGEEPYTIAMTLFDYYQGKTNRPDFKILATDIDTQVIQKGIDGVYSLDQTAGVGPDQLKRYFLKGSGENSGFYKAKDSLRETVSFRRLNLLLDDYPMKKQFDVIFCRNVIIYFDRETQAKLFDRMYRYLKDDGYLLVGHSENISSITNKFHLTGRTIYRKVL